MLFEVAVGGLDRLAPEALESFPEFFHPFLEGWKEVVGDPNPDQPILPVGTASLEGTIATVATPINVVGTLLFFPVVPHLVEFPASGTNQHVLFGLMAEVGG